MTDGTPPTLRLSQKRHAGEVKPVARVKPSEKYSGFSEYYAAEVAPRELANARRNTPVNLGYPHMKRRRP